MGATQTGRSLDYRAVLSEADTVLAFCSPRLLEAAPKLRFLHSYSVGVERCTLAETIDEYDFVLTNNQRLSGPDIAEHTIAMMFTLARNLVVYQRHQQQSNWQRGERQAVNLNGRTLLVLGLGGIGTEIARRASALGMKVIATRNSSRNGPPFVDYVGLSDETHELASRADFIANALPLTNSTRGMVDEAFFAAAKAGAFYISVGRGQTTDTDALVAALVSGHIAGAGLDVTDPEPLTADHPLWSMDNVVITPHVAANTMEARQRTLVIAVENLRRYVLGEPVLGLVDFKRGY
jgi:phosphoglycerate dehydrogenase-like enzyme